MDEKRTVKRKSAELDWFDLFMEILSHWRGIILMVILGFAVFALIGFLMGFKEKKEAEAASLEDIQKNLTIEELRSKIGPDDMTYAEDVITNEGYIREIEQNRSTSPLYSIEAKNTPTLTLTLRMVGKDGAGKSIAYVYNNVLNTAGMYDYVGQKSFLGQDAESLIVMDESKVDTIVFHFCNVSLEECNIMADAFLEYVKSKESALQSYAKHEVIVVDRAEGTVYDSSIEKKQKEAADLIKKYMTVIEKDESNLTLNGLYYLKLRIMEEFGDEKIIEDLGVDYYEKAAREGIIIAKQGKNKVGNNATPKEAENPLKTAAKMGILGVIVFAFLYIVIIGFAYALSSKINDVDEFDTLYGIASFGKIYRDRTSKLPGKGIDRAICRARRRGRKLVPEEEAKEIIVSSISAAAAKENMKNVAVLGVKADDGLASSIEKALSGKGINAVIMNNPALGAKEAERLSETDGAVIIAYPKTTCYGEVWDEIELLNNRGITVLGGALV